MPEYIFFTILPPGDVVHFSVDLPETMLRSCLVKTIQNYWEFWIRLVVTDPGWSRGFLQSVNPVKRLHSLMKKKYPAIRPDHLFLFETPEGYPFDSYPVLREMIKQIKKQ